MRTRPGYPHGTQQQFGFVRTKAQDQMVLTGRGKNSLQIPRHQDILSRNAESGWVAAMADGWWLVGERLGREMDRWWWSRSRQVEQPPPRWAPRRRRRVSTKELAQVPPLSSRRLARWAPPPSGFSRLRGQLTARIWNRVRWEFIFCFHGLPHMYSHVKSNFKPCLFSSTFLFECTYRQVEKRNSSLGCFYLLKSIQNPPKKWKSSTNPPKSDKSEIRGQFYKFLGMLAL